jgi:hypothetical protein
MVYEPSMMDTISLGIYDWDRVGTDELVAQVKISLQKLKKKKKKKPQPFYLNLYGAPLVGGKEEHQTTITNPSTNKIKKQMNLFPEMATCYRGRLLLSIRLVDKMDINGKFLLDEIQKKHHKKQTTKIPPLSKLQMPLTDTYTLKAWFLLGSELPIFTSSTRLGQYSKLQLIVSCGLHEICSSRGQIYHHFHHHKNGGGGSTIEWNDFVQSDPIVFPQDPKEIPDIFLYLCKGNGKKRQAICYKRFKANNLFKVSNSVPVVPEVAWVTLQEDPVLKALKQNEFPGNVLVHLALERSFVQEKATSSTSTVVQEEIIKKINQKVPYQVRVHLYQGRNFPAFDSNGLLDPYFEIFCMGKKQQQTKIKQKTKDPLFYETKIFDLNLPSDLKYSPQVILRLMDYDPFDSDDFVGLVFLNLADAIVRQNSSSNIWLQNTNLPEPKWYPIQEPQGEKKTGGEILVSIELIRKQFLEEIIPIPQSIVPKKKKAFLEIIVLGLRQMEPFQFMPIQFPFI